MLKKVKQRSYLANSRRDPPTPGGDWISKGGELEMSLTQLNFGSRSEMVKIKNASMSVAVHSDGLRMRS